MTATANGFGRQRNPRAQIRRNNSVAAAKTAAPSTEPDALPFDDDAPADGQDGDAGKAPVAEAKGTPKADPPPADAPVDDAPESDAEPQSDADDAPEPVSEAATPATQPEPPKQERKPSAAKSAANDEGLKLVVVDTDGTVTADAGIHVLDLRNLPSDAHSLVDTLVELKTVAAGAARDLATDRLGASITRAALGD